MEPSVEVAKKNLILASKQIKNLGHITETNMPKFEDGLRQLEEIMKVMRVELNAKKSEYELYREADLSFKKAYTLYDQIQTRIDGYNRLVEAWKKEKNYCEPNRPKFQLLVEDLIKALQEARDYVDPLLLRQIYFDYLRAQNYLNNTTDTNFAEDLNAAIKCNRYGVGGSSTSRERFWSKRLNKKHTRSPIKLPKPPSLFKAHIKTALTFQRNQ